MLYVVLYLVVGILIYILLNKYLPYTGLEYEIDEEINLVYPIDEDCYKAIQVCRALLWPIFLLSCICRAILAIINYRKLTK